MSRVKPKHVLMLNGKPVSRRAFFKRRMSDPGVPMLGRRTLPMSGNTVEGYSIAMSVHPDEVPLMNELLKAEGVTGAHYDPTEKHNCRITSVEGQKGVARVLSRMHGSRIYNEDE